MRLFIKHILEEAKLLVFAQKLYVFFVRIRDRLEVYLLLPALVKSGLVRRIYFAFFSGSFTSEMRLYVAGRYRYLLKVERGEINESLLRRNIHRIEKGLMTPERKEVFALEYISETVNQFVESVNENGSTLLNDWAADILSQYFKISGSHSIIAKATKRFEETYYLKSNPEVSRLPFTKPKVEPDALNHFIMLLEARKSVRRFVPGSVPRRDIVEEAVRLASLAPSSCNRQPFKFVVLTETEKIVKIGRLAGGARTFAETIPALVLLVGSTSLSPSPGDRHLMYIDGSLAAMNFMLALETMGVSSCPINWPDNKRPEKMLRRLVHIEKHERPVMLIAMGKAEESGVVACSARKEVSELLKYNP
jgi:nitroreductase